MSGTATSHDLPCCCHQADRSFDIVSEAESLLRDVSNLCSTFKLLPVMINQEDVEKFPHLQKLDRLPPIRDSSPFPPAIPYSLILKLGPVARKTPLGASLHRARAASPGLSDADLSTPDRKRPFPLSVGAKVRAQARRSVK